MMAGSSQRRRSSVFGQLRTRLESNLALREKIKLGVSVGVLSIVFIWLLLPIFWVFQTALKTRPVAIAYPPVLWGFEIRWENFVVVLTETPLPSFIFNGLIVATAVTALGLLMGVPHAYVVSKYESRLGNLSFWGIVAARIIPPISIIVPFYVAFSSIGLIDTLVAVILVETAMVEPFIVYIMKGYFDSLSNSLVDSARIDGCNKYQAFYKVMLPIASPGMGSAAIIAWLLGWNAFTTVFVLTTSPNAQTLPVGILTYSQDVVTPWNLFAAAAVIGLIPSVLIVIVCQQYLMRGLVEGEGGL